MKGTFSRKRYTKGVPFLSKMVYKRVRGWTMLQTPSPPKPPTPPPPHPCIKFCSVLLLWAAIITKIQSSQIAQTKYKWSSDELRNGSNNKGMIILKIK